MSSYLRLDGYAEFTVVRNRCKEDLIEHLELNWPTFITKYWFYCTDSGVQRICCDLHIASNVIGFISGWNASYWSNR